MVIKDGAKMSKSKGNVVSPDEMIASSASTPRACTLSSPRRPTAISTGRRTASPASAASSPRLPPHHEVRSRRALARRQHPRRRDRAREFAGRNPAELALLRTLHQTIAKITEDFSGRWHFNTCIAAIMILVNEIIAAEPAMDSGAISPATIAELLRSLTLMLAPFAPFLAAELWQQLGEQGSVFAQPWPVADAELARESEIEIPVQINGKLVTVIKLSADADEDAIKAASLADEKVAARLAGKTIVKHLVINKPSGKLVNLVVK
jgi:leucyl-tRNA synthetase